MPTYATTTQATLRGLSDAMLMLVAQIESLEHHKRELPTDHPMFLELSTEVVELSRELLEGAAEEESAARAAGSYAALNGHEVADLRAILQEWNTVRDALRAADPGSPEMQHLRGVATALRRDFMRQVREREQATALQGSRGAEVSD